ncbi:MAG: hypothetical protein DDT40_01301 [candidate division WS2 bacterium]|nr:hypothetical protein [Candidatus Psychracetigena formicireducens]
MKPLVVCLCGSTRFVNTFVEQQKILARKRVIVLSIELVFPQPITDNPQHSDPPLKVLLDELHLRKIDLADEILVLNVGGYIGWSTRNEINYAVKTGKLVRYLEPIKMEEEYHGSFKD